jgi:hypothetical protein
VKWKSEVGKSWSKVQDVSLDLRARVFPPEVESGVVGSMYVVLARYAIWHRHTINAQLGVFEDLIAMLMRWRSIKTFHSENKCRYGFLRISYEWSSGLIEQNYI